ncbi:MAG: hypothetical protein Q6L60_04250 [Thermostichus sp. HHBFW_bins_43]
MSNESSPSLLTSPSSLLYLQPRLGADLPEGSRLRDSTADQVYGGLNRETAATTRETRNEK